MPPAPIHILAPHPPKSTTAVFEFYSRDRLVLDVESSYLAQDLVSLGYLNSMPRQVDVGHAQELIREAER
jgi:hypothetical protein